MVELLRPGRGGFLRPFGCGWFIREFLSGRGPAGSPVIDPEVGAPQADIFHHYKMALLQATALDRAARREEKLAKREQRPIDPQNIEKSSGITSYIISYVDGPLEAAIATHPHSDHIGGLISVLNSFDVLNIWTNGDSTTSHADEGLGGLHIHGAGTILERGEEISPI